MKADTPPGFHGNHNSRTRTLKSPLHTEWALCRVTSVHCPLRNCLRRRSSTVELRLCLTHPLLWNLCDESRLIGRDLKHCLLDWRGFLPIRQGLTQSMRCTSRQQQRTLVWDDAKRRRRPCGFLRPAWSHHRTPCPKSMRTWADIHSGCTNTAHNSMWHRRYLSPNVSTGLTQIGQSRFQRFTFKVVKMPERDSGQNVISKSDINVAGDNLCLVRRSPLYC